MATAFTKQEKESIHKKLKQAALYYAATIGMRKTTVEQLVQDAGISKGAFYKFYPSKELLFFEIMNDLHEKLYSEAWSAFQHADGLPKKERIARAFIRAFEVLEQDSMIDFLENDSRYLVRKLPQEVIKAHFLIDDGYVSDILQRANLHLTESPEVISALFRGIFLSLSHRKEIGPENYKRVLEILISSVCDHLLKNDNDT